MLQLVIQGLFMLGSVCFFVGTLLSFLHTLKVI